MLIRLFYKVKVSYDLLSWITNIDKFTKVKYNQILMHLASLFMQMTTYSFEGQLQDTRLGLPINEACLKNHKHYESTAIIVGFILLIR